MRKFTVMIALLLVVALATPAIGASFPDVPSNHWAYEAINTLVAAGIIEGYPDGTYKGQRNLTRYEIAMIVSRVLDNIEEERAAMMDKIDSMEKTEAGLTTEQAQDVTAIVKALMQKNMPEVPEMPEELTDKQADQVVNLIEALTFEYQAELKVLGSDIEDLQMDLDEVEARVAALEAEEPIVSFSGEYSVDFTNVWTTDGEAIVPADEEDAESVFTGGTTPYEANGYYFEDPYSVSSGYYLEQLDSDTTNEFDDSDDFRIADGEDYYEDELEFVNALDLSMAVNKGALSADIDFTATSNYFGEADEYEYELDDISGTITTSDFTATIADEQTVTFKDYLFDEATVDGVVVTSDNHTFFVSRTLEEVTASTPENDPGENGYTDIVWGDEDNYDYYERSFLRAGASMNFDLMLPVNVLFGYEYSAAGDFDLLNTVDDEATSSAVTSESVSEIKNAVLGLATETEFAGMDVTADFATALFDDVDDDYLFRLGASGQLDMFDVAFNYEKTQNMTFIESDADNTEGFDVEVGGTLGMVDGSVYYEDYDDYNLTTINLAVPAGNLSFGGVDVDGSYELTTDSDEGHDEYRQINASTTMAGFDLSYMYDYNADNNIWDDEVDMLDNGQEDSLTAGDADYYYEEEDDDLNLHTFDASYALNESLTVGLTSEFEKGILDDASDITWEDEFTNTNTLTADYASGPLTAGLDYELDGGATAEARYTADMYEAGVEFNFNNDDEADNDTIIDGKIMSPVYTVWGVDVSGEASFERNLDTEDQDLGVMVSMAKDFNERLAMTASMEYGDKEIDVDYAGVKLAAKAGVEYSVTEDISATADYEYLDWEGDTNGDYTAQKATAGVSVAF